MSADLLDGFERILGTLAQTYTDVRGTAAVDSSVPDAYPQQTNPVNNNGVPLSSPSYASSAQTFIQDNALLVIGALLAFMFVALFIVGLVS